MVIFNPRPQRSGNILPQVVGVFEDDTLLLSLSARCRPAECACWHASGPIDSDDLAFDDERLIACETWDL
jgi:hypothetical protein